MLLAAPAAWADVTARADLGVAQPVSAPTRDYFGTGFDLGAAVGVDLTTFLELGGRLSYIFVSKASGSTFGGPASLIAFGPALRVHRPRLGARWAPWLELGLQYVRTGPLDRLGLAVTAGAQFELRDRLWLGPWLGVQQVFHLADTMDYPTRDATVFVAGVSVDFAVWAPRREPSSQPEADPVDPGERDRDHDGVVTPNDRCPNTREDLDGYQDDDGCPDLDDDQDGVLDADDACPRSSGTVATLGCPDRDLDGIADTDDRCPDVRGLSAQAGCPAYREVKVGTTRIELGRPIDFAKTSSTVPQRSVPTLDELALALGDRQALCVRIAGHPDATPSPALARARADAVRVHLMTRGISPSRLTVATEPGPGDIELVLVPCEVKTP